MGAPKGGDFVGEIGKNIEYSAKDIVGGAEDVLKGNVSSGLSSMLAGNLGLNTMGISQVLLPGKTALTAKAKAAEDAKEQDRINSINMEREARLNRITTRLNEEIKLRQKAPGKAQTLLTSTLTPNSQMTGTLLTGAKR